MRIETVGNITKIDKLNAKAGTMSLKELVGKEPQKVVGAMFIYKNDEDGDEERISYIKFENGDIAGGKSAVVADALSILFEDEEVLKEGISCEILEMQSNGGRDFLNVRWS